MKGFTVIELMVVVAIIAILVAIGAGAVKDNDGTISIDTNKVRDAFNCDKAKRKQQQPEPSGDGYTVE